MPPAKPAKDAFAQLMASRSRQEMTPGPKRSGQASRATGDGSSGFRMALGAYIADPSPSKHPPSTIIYSNDGFVALRDKFPKATVHALLLPRSAAHSLLHPFDAFEDAEFLASVRVEADRLKALAASELQRKLGVLSRTESARQTALDDAGEDEEDKKEDNLGKELPPGRDWAAEIRCGVHACPSMAHLHVHVFSRDMHSHALKHRKHYNSFNTPFLVDLADLPLHELDPRRHPTRQGYLGGDLKCWRCHENFGNRFQELKSHLEQEFEEWKAE